MNTAKLRVLERAYDGIPKPIKPRLHRWLDFGTAAAFLTAGGIFLKTRNTRAAIASFINGGMVLGLSLATNYPGVSNGPISFPLHGKLDVGQASMAGALPTLMGFGDTGAAIFFRVEAGTEAAVVSMTDFQYGRSKRQRVA